MSLAYDRHVASAQKRPAAHHVWLARTPFLVFAIGGIALLVLLKWLDVNQWVVSGMAGALILVYAAAVAFIPALRIREDQLGDNCYYLGFLYTLSSLAWALWRFSQFNDVVDIVSSFGLALFSTIVGILLRVAINQARKDILETERDARMQLTAAVDDMRIQLNHAVISLRSFCGQAQQITADAIRDNAERANTALEQSVSKVGDASSAVLARIDTAFEEFHENTTKLNQVAAGTVRALETLVTRLEQMEPPSDLISKRIEGVMAVAEQAGGLLRRRLESDERAISEASERIKEMEERLKAAAGFVAVAGSGLTGVAESSRQAVAAAEAAARKLTELTDLMTGSISLQERLAIDARTSAERLNTSVIDTQKRLADEARQSLESLFAALKAHNDAMEGELQRARRMASDTGNALADMADTLTARVQDMRDPKIGRPAILGDAAE
jgi:hypothetical protein